MNSELFEYRKTDLLVNEIAGLYPRLNDKFTLNKSDAINWVVYVLRQLGKGITEPQIYNLEIQDHKVKLPGEISVIDGVYKNKCTSLITNNFNYQYPIRYVGGKNSNIISTNCAKLAPYNIGTTFSINYPYLIFNFTDSCVGILAQSLRIDPDTSIPMYPDEESTKQAIQEYILMQWLREPAELGEYDWNKWLLHKSLYENYFSQAKGFFLMPSELEAGNIISNTNYKYNRFKIPRRRRNYY
jgi:hypothetical protein